MVAPLGAAPGRPQRPAAWSTSFSPATQWEAGELVFGADLTGELRT
jgi:hypothetical protein